MSNPLPTDDRYVVTAADAWGYHFGNELEKDTMGVLERNRVYNVLSFFFSPLVGIARLVDALVANYSLNERFAYQLEYDLEYRQYIFELDAKLKRPQYYGTAEYDQDLENIKTSRKFVWMEIARAILEICFLGPLLSIFVDGGVTLYRYCEQSNFQKA